MRKDIQKNIVNIVLQLDAVQRVLDYSGAIRRLVSSFERNVVSENTFRQQLSLLEREKPAALKVVVSDLVEEYIRLVKMERTIKDEKNKDGKK
jgi:hypothetical protein